MASYLGSGMAVFVILVGVVVFIIAVFLIRWIFGIGKIIDLLTTIAKQTEPKPPDPAVRQRQIQEALDPAKDT